MTEPPQYPRDDAGSEPTSPAPPADPLPPDAAQPDPLQWRAPDPLAFTPEASFPPAPPAAPTPPPPPAWQPPGPLSFGPPEPPPGPLVSPSISAYQPPPVTPPTDEPPTGTLPPPAPVTSPPASGAPASGAPVYGPPTTYPTPQAPPPAVYYPPQYAGYGGGGYVTNPYAGYSDKSKIAAGLLQLLLGTLLTIGGVGRLYAGQTSLGGIQLGLSILAWVGGFCSGGILLLLLCPLWVWFLVDGIVMLAGNPVDGQGRPLRP